jgi:hypothetical protein
VLQAWNLKGWGKAQYSILVLWKKKEKSINFLAQHSIPVPWKKKQEGTNFLLVSACNCSIEICSVNGTTGNKRLPGM